MSKSLSTSPRQFFNDIRHGRLNRLEIYHISKELSDNFDHQCLIILKDDFISYLITEKLQFRTKYSKAEIDEVSKGFDADGNPIFRVQYMHNDNNPSPWILVQGHYRIDMEETLQQFEFDECYNFIAFLRSKIALTDQSKEVYINPKSQDNIDITLAAEETPNQLDLKRHLGEAGFFDLPKVKILQKDAIEHLLKLLKKDLPYKISMLTYLGFIDHLINVHFKSQIQSVDYLAKTFELKKDPKRAIKGNINVLNPASNEDKKRYTAHKHSCQVERDYENLK